MVNAGSAASKYATLFDESKATAWLERVAPPAVYPVPLTSFEVVYADVVAPKDALDVYNAIFKVSHHFLSYVHHLNNLARKCLLMFALLPFNFSYVVACCILFSPNTFMGAL